MSKTVVERNVIDIVADYERRIQVLERRAMGTAFAEYEVKDNPFPYILHNADFYGFNYINDPPNPPFGWKIGPEGVFVRKSEDWVQWSGTIQWTGVIPRIAFWPDAYGFHFPPEYFGDFVVDSLGWGPLPYELLPTIAPFQQISLLGYEADGSNPQLYDVIADSSSNPYKMRIVQIGGGFLSQEITLAQSGLPPRPTFNDSLPDRPGMDTTTGLGTIEGYTLSLNTLSYSQYWPADQS